MAIPSTGAISFTTIQTEFGGSNPIGLNEYYAGGAYVPAGTTGTNGAVPSSGAICVNKFHGTQATVIGQIAYTTAGCYTWVAPSGVSSVSIVAVGGGGAGYGGCSNAGTGGGGGLGYKNNQAVTPGSSYAVTVGRGGLSTRGICFVNQNGVSSTFKVSGTTVVAGNFGYGARNGRTGGTYSGTGGGNGGVGGISGDPGGGGAGGYSGTGGNGSYNASGLYCGSGGGGGGGKGGTGTNGGGGGGGVGILGQGSNGAAGTGDGGGGGGGSGGSSGVNGSQQSFFCPCCGPYLERKGGAGGAYGGGGGYGAACAGAGNGGGGAVRIIWPGTTRSFPSTNTGNL